VTPRVTIKELGSVRWSVAREPAFELARSRALWLAVAVLVLFCGLGTVWYDRAADAQLPVDPVGVGVVGVLDGANRCVGTLEQASQALGFSCPKALCAARVLAANCRALPRGMLKTATHGCAESSALQGVSFELSATRRKVCFYAQQKKWDEPQLVGVDAWDDQARYCSGTAARISAGRVRTECIGPIDSTACDLEHPEQSQPQLGGPPRACFLINSCEVCCPDVAPDCSDKPDGYPGYECARPAPDNINPCVCRAGRWSCD